MQPLISLHSGDLKDTLKAHFLLSYVAFFWLRSLLNGTAFRTRGLSQHTQRCHEHGPSISEPTPRRLSASVLLYGGR